MSGFEAVTGLELGSLEVRIEDPKIYTLDDLITVIETTRRTVRTEIVSELMSAGEPIAAEIVRNS